MSCDENCFFWCFSYYYVWINNELVACALQVFQWYGLAVPAILVFHKVNAFSFERASDDCCWLVFIDRVECCLEFVDVVTIDGERVPAKCVKACGVRVYVMLVSCCSALAETVDINDAAQIIQLVKRCKVSGFPDVAFSKLAVAC